MQPRRRRHAQHTAQVSRASNRPTSSYDWQQALPQCQTRRTQGAPSSRPPTSPHRHPSPGVVGNIHRNQHALASLATQKPSPPATPSRQLGLHPGLSGRRSTCRLRHGSPLPFLLRQHAQEARQQVQPLRQEIGPGVAVHSMRSRRERKAYEPLRTVHRPHLLNPTQDPNTAATQPQQLRQ